MTDVPCMTVGCEPIRVLMAFEVQGGGWRYGHRDDPRLAAAVRRHGGHHRVGPDVRAGYVAGASLSGQGDPHRGAVSGRRLGRRARPHPRAGDAVRQRLDGRGREQGRGLRCSRYARGRAGGGRWAHARPRHQPDARHERVHDEGSGLRSDRGLRAGGRSCGPSACARGAQGVQGRFGGGPDRHGQSGARHAQLRLDGQRFRLAPRHGAVQEQGCLLYTSRCV